LKEDINIKLNKFQRICRTIWRTLRQKTMWIIQLKFYKIMAVPMLTYASENWTINRSDKMKIVSWNEVPVFRSWMYSPRSKTNFRHTFRIKSIQFNWENRKAKQNWNTF
jgi:hypothetical protein